MCHTVKLDVNSLGNCCNYCMLLWERVEMKKDKRKQECMSMETSWLKKEVYWPFQQGISKELGISWLTWRSCRDLYERRFEPGDSQFFIYALLKTWYAYVCSKAFSIDIHMCIFVAFIGHFTFQLFPTKVYNNCNSWLNYSDNNCITKFLKSPNPI